MHDLNIFATMGLISDYQGSKVIQNIQKKIIAAVRPNNEAEFDEIA